MPLKDRSFKLERAQNKKKHEYQHPTIHPNKYRQDPRSNFPYRMEGVDPTINGFYIGML